MSLSYSIHTSVITILPSLLPDQQDIDLLLRLLDHTSFCDRIFNDDYKDMLVASYDRFMRATPLCPLSVKRSYALRNTALRVYYGIIKPKMTALSTPPPTAMHSPAQL